MSREIVLHEEVLDPCPAGRRNVNVLVLSAVTQQVGTVCRPRLDSVRSNGRAGGGAKAVGLQSPRGDHWVTLLLPRLARGFEVIG